MARRYLRSLITTPPSVPEILLFFEKNAYNFCQHCLKFDFFMSIYSLAYADFNDISYVIFQQCDWLPYWSKCKTVFLLLLLQNSSNFVQTCAQMIFGLSHIKVLSPIFLLYWKKKSYDVANLMGSTHNWFRGCNLWTVCHKIIKLVSIDSLRHVESEDIYFARIGCTTSLATLALS